MEQIAYSQAAQLASDIRSTHLSIDEALSDIANLTQSMLSVCRESTISAARSQAAIEEVTGGMVQMVAARKGFVAAHKHMVVVHKRSNLQEVNFGCDGNGPIRITTGLRVVNS
jgi:hypothetical protein